MNEYRKVLILFFHPRFEDSRANRILVNEVQDMMGVTFKDMYELYADFNIDVSKEQNDLLEHEVIFWMHPFYWYSCPPLMKQWIDLVLTNGWAYGQRGDKLKGKWITNIITAGGSFEVYQKNGKNRFTFREFLYPFDQTAYLCQMRYLPPFVVPAASRLSMLELERYSEKLKTSILLLQDLRFDVNKLDNFIYFNDIHSDQWQGTILQNALIFLGISLLTVPVAKRLGIGSVLGYLLGGILIGPYAIGWIGKEGEDIMHASEFGVVMMLFVIGLELDPSAFWRMRKTIVGMGAGQMLLSAGLLFVPLIWGFALPWTAAVALALTLAMSSTAIVLQTLKERNLGKTEAGLSSFSILLFQDIAVIPILALIPLLAPQLIVGSDHPSKHSNWIEGLDAPYSTLIILAAVGVIFLSGKYIINPLLRWIAKVHMRELFTAAALFIVIGVAWLMEKVGISAALGTFLAGVLLANSEFRHELESDIEPFKGVLLGLFFTAVGSTVNFELILSDTQKIILFVLTVMFLKGLVLFIIARVSQMSFDQNLLMALLLCQVGEFAFVLLAAVGQYQLISKEEQDFFVAAVTLSMLLSPLLLYFFEKWIAPRFGVKENPEPLPHDQISEHHSVVLAGFGHFGSTLGRFLRANGVSATILDNDSERVALLRKMGFNVYYGDATRLDLLHTAGVAQAEIFISAIDSPEKNTELVEIIQKYFPNIILFVRAKNRYDAYDLIDKSVNHIYRESLHTSVQMGVDVLKKLGFRAYTVTRKAAEFIKYDEAALEKLSKNRKERQSYINSVREEIALQEKLLQEDYKFTSEKNDMAWDGRQRND